MRYFVLWSLLLFCSVAIAQEPEQTSARSIDEKLQEILNKPEYKHAHWGLLVVDQKSDNILHELNPDRLFVPASVTKIYSTAAVLDALGADHRFKTPVVRRGEVNDQGVLEGDLIFVAIGDPTLGGRTDENDQIEHTASDHTYAGGRSSTVLTKGNPLRGLDDLAQQVAQSGIKKVQGKIAVDDRIFYRVPSSGSGPVRVGPVSINDNVVDIIVAPAETEGEPAVVSWRPESAAIQIENRATTGAKESGNSTRIERIKDGHYVVHGSLAAGERRVIHIQEILDPSRFARTLFIEALQRAGVDIAAELQAENSLEGLPDHAETLQLPKVAEHVSAPVIENVKLILKVSHNPHASMMPMILAAKHSKRSLYEGLGLQREFLDRAGVQPETISFGGGAGGTDADFVTPRSAYKLLKYMSGTPHAEAYKLGMPVMAVDGTLGSAVGEDSPSKGKFWAKTGTLFSYNAMNRQRILTGKTIAGYGKTASDRDIIIAVFVNNVHLNDEFTTGSVGRDLGRICEIVYEHY